MFYLIVALYIMENQLHTSTGKIGASVFDNIIGSQLAQHESTIDIVAVGVITAGGTGDLAAVFEDLLSRHPSSQWVLVGFSLGANIGVRFIGERVHWRSHFLCAMSVCQGYDPNQ